MRGSTSVRGIAVALVGLGAATLWSAQAHAEEIFPAVIAEEANMPCVPTCVLCHTSNPGRADTWPTKKFGLFMGTHGAMKGDANSIRTAFKAYAALSADATVAAGLKNLQQGLDPDNGNNLCGPTYGCGAHVAQKAPPSDLAAPLWVVGAVVAGGLLRRRRRPAAS